MSQHIAVCSAFLGVYYTLSASTKKKPAAVCGCQLLLVCCGRSVRPVGLNKDCMLCYGLLYLLGGDGNIAARDRGAAVL